MAAYLALAVPAALGTALALAAGGVLDPGFGHGGVVRTPVGTGESFAVGLVRGSHGKLVAAGFQQSQGLAGFALVRYEPDGSIDTSFGDHGKVRTRVGTEDARPETAVGQANGKIVVAGEGSDASQIRTGFTLVRYNRDGSLDKTFGNGGKVFTYFQPGSTFSVVRALAVQPDGRLVAAGEFTDGDTGESSFALARYNHDGSLDATFGQGGRVVTRRFPRAQGTRFSSVDSGVEALVVQRNGKLVAAGYALPQGQDSTHGRGHLALVRYLPDGTIDTAYGHDGRVTGTFGGNAYADAAVQEPDGGLLVAGGTYGKPGRHVLVTRYERDGTRDKSLLVKRRYNNSGSYAAAIVRLPDGRFAIAGLAHRGGKDVFLVARYERDGRPDGQFAPGGAAYTQVGGGGPAEALMARRGGKLVAAGVSFAPSSSPGGESAFGLARYRAGH